MGIIQTGIKFTGKLFTPAANANVRPLCKRQIQTLETLGLEFKRPICNVKEIKLNEKNSVFDTELWEVLKHFGRDIKLGKVPRARALLDMPYGCMNNSAFSYIMDIGIKERAVELAKFDSEIAKRLKLKPQLVHLTEEEQIAKNILDEAFEKVAPNPCDSIQHRGIRLQSTSPAYKRFLCLKKGDVINETYIYTSPIYSYASGYASKTGEKDVSVIYNILLPKGSKMLCPVGEISDETVIKGCFEVCDIIKEGKDLQLFIEHII